MSLIDCLAAMLLSTMQNPFWFSSANLFCSFDYILVYVEIVLHYNKLMLCVVSANG